MSKFKAGDLALIINSACEENIGRVVQLVRYYSADTAIIRGYLFGTRYGAPAWEVDLIAAPDLINQQWVRRYDLRIRLRRKIERTYPVLNILSADTPIITG